MATLANAHFDDSEDEDDFNPAPADLSDNDDAVAQIQNEAAHRPSRDDGSEDGPTSEQVNNRRRDSGAGNDGDEDDKDAEDAEGEGEDTALRADGDDEEDEEEEEEVEAEDEDEDDEEEEITVSIRTDL
jgi:transcription elongation factor SPT5